MVNKQVVIVLLYLNPDATHKHDITDSGHSHTITDNGHTQQGRGLRFKSMLFGGVGITIMVLVKLLVIEMLMKLQVLQVIQLVVIANISDLIERWWYFYRYTDLLTLLFVI